jgi:TPR repeat protein
MKTFVFVLGFLLAMPIYAAELGDSYVKLFNVQLQIAKSGNPGAQYSLGQMYEQGLGTKTNLEKAYEWYEKAAKQGDVRAKHKLATRNQPQDTLDLTPEPEVAPAKADPKLAAKKKAEAARLAAKKKAAAARLMAKKRAAAKAALAKQIAEMQAHESDIGW